MTWSQSETDIYEQALKAVEDNNKLLARMYLKTQKDIADKLKQFFLSVDPSWSEAYKIKRVEEIIKEQYKTIDLMTVFFVSTLTASFLSVYTKTFAEYGKLIEPLTGETIEIITEKAIKNNIYNSIGEFNFLKHEKEAADIFRKKLRDMVKESIDKGEGPAKLAKKLKDEFGARIARHTATARTEMLTSYSLAQEEAVNQAEELGIEFKFKWLGRNDGRERPTHIALNGTYAKKADDGEFYFYGGGCKGTSPRLFEGVNSAAMNVNCRCRRLNIPVI